MNTGGLGDFSPPARVDVRELALAGQDMRRKQEAYFRSRAKGQDLDLLKDARRAEVHFDLLVKAVLEPEPRGLFDEEDAQTP